MTNKTLTTIAFALTLVFLYSLNFASAIVVDTNYITIYPGEEGKITLKIDNNENFDIEKVSASLLLDNLPFSSIGSSEKDVDDINEDDDDSASFTIKASSDIKPGDYEIPYLIKYTNAQTNEPGTKTGSFGIRVSAKTEVSYSVDVSGSAVQNQQGKISLEIINKGLGEIKSVDVQLTPQGFELLSSNQVFIGTINADDTDTATFDVIFTTTAPVLKAKVTYKDFENNAQTDTVNLPFKVYTQEEAFKLGIIKKSNTGTYFLVLIVLLIIWFVWRRIKKARKKNNKLRGEN